MSKEGAWTEEEESLLSENYTTLSIRALSDMLGRSIPSVEGKARRLGLRKPDARQGEGDSRDGYKNQFEMMTREDALKLDKIDLLRVNWSLFEMYRQELNNPGLSKAQRHRLMNALSNHTSIINSVIKGSEEQLGDEARASARNPTIKLYVRDIRITNSKDRRHPTRANAWKQRASTDAHHPSRSNLHHSLRKHPRRRTHPRHLPGRLRGL